jgi:hypothetical protein
LSGDLLAANLPALISLLVYALLECHSLAADKQFPKSSLPHLELVLHFFHHAADHMPLRVQ